MREHGFTAIPYREGTGTEQGFPCVLFPVRKSTREKPSSHYRLGFAVSEHFSYLMNYQYPRKNKKLLLNCWYVSDIWIRPSFFLNRHTTLHQLQA
jgi:hypothetical protein